MEKMVKGIKSVDIVTGWEPEDYVQASFANNELGAFFKRHCEAILKAAPGTVELKATLAERQDNLNSTMTTTSTMATMRVFLFMQCFLSFQNLSDTLLRLAARHHHFMCAAAAAELDIHADAGNHKDLCAAGMGLFHLHPVAELQIHVICPL
jgi:hypothetical protein